MTNRTRDAFALASVPFHGHPVRNLLALNRPRFSIVELTTSLTTQNHQSVPGGTAALCLRLLRVEARTPQRETKGRVWEGIFF